MDESELKHRADVSGDASREDPTETVPASTVDETLRQIHALDEQDSGLWARTLLLILVLLAGILSFIYPRMMWGFGEINLDTRYLPQFFFGLTALVVLYNAHLLDQRRKVRFAREEMVRQLLHTESTESKALIDPLTQVYNRRYLDKVLRRELSRADRSDATLVIMMIDLDGFKAVNTKYGHLAGDQVLCEVAELLNRVFRRSDTVVRYGGDEFLILMPDTKEEQAVHAIDRLQKEGAAWSQKDFNRKYSVGFSCGISTYRKGGNIKMVIQDADERMYAEKAKHHAAAQGESRSQSA